MVVPVLAAHTVTPLDLADVRGGIHARLRAVVQAQPDAIALTDGDNAWTFADVAARACAIAAQVRGLPYPHRPVTVLADHQPAGAVAALGVLLSGRPLLVLDPLVPAPRLRGYVERLGARVCLADTPANLEVATRILPADSAPIVPPTAVADVAPAGPPAWDPAPDPAAVAALGFTSGSTGQPKVVALSGRHLVGDAWAGSTVGDCVRPDDVMAHTLPFAFAAGMNALMTGLLSGATTALYDTRTRGIAGLAAWIAASRVSVVHASPAILRAFVGTAPDPARLATLRSFTLGGEAAHGRDVVAARQVLPATCTVFHRFGSTETGLVAQLLLHADDAVPDGPLPVGEPIGVTRVRLVDEDGEPVPDGEPGTVEVTRSYLATGYWGDVDATTAAFADGDDDLRVYRSRDLGRFEDGGRLRLLGRRDHSVKIRGYLVEPGEVDAALFALPDVREAVTVGRPRPDDGVLELVSYLVPAVQQLSQAAVRAQLREVLPSHMVPPTIVLLDALPRTERGKIDRSALPEPPRRAAGSAGQEFSAWERLVAQVFMKALSIEDIGLDDDFFELGGDSLAAEALITQMVDGVGVDAGDATTALLVQAPTVREFAARLTRKAQGNDVLVPLQPTGRQQPLFLVAGGGGLGVAFLWLSRLLGADQPMWALQGHGIERRALPDHSVEAIARRNVAALRRVQPKGPYLLAGHSFGGVVAFEMAHQLRRSGSEVNGLILLDCYPPDPALLPPEPPPADLAARVKEPLGLALTGLRRASSADLYWHFYRLSGWMQRRYRGRPWRGDALVVVAEDEEDRELRSRWERHLTGSWELVSVPGDHLSMMRDPYVTRLAEVVATTLQRWRDEKAARDAVIHRDWTRTPSP